MWIQRLTTLLRFPFSLKQIINRIIFLISRKNKILPYRPLRLLFYLSDICNLQCKMCPTHTVSDVSAFDYKKTDFGIMKFDTFSRILQNFPEATLVMLAGVGEPLLNPDFLKIITCCSESRKKINLVTNGILLSEEKMDAICKNQWFNEISISLNASNEADYNKITHTNNGHYDAVIKNIIKIVKKKQETNSKVKIIVSAVCSNEFIEKMYDFAFLASQLQVDKIVFHNYINFNIIEQNDQWTALDSSIKRQKQLFKQIQKIQSANLSCKNIEFPKINITLPSRFEKKCERFFKSLSFDAYGNIGSCGRVMNPNRRY